jgi:hypothetical protein
MLNYRTQLKWHRIAAWLVMIPFTLTLATGTLLLLRKEISWIQPAEVKLDKTAPGVIWQPILDTLRNHSASEIRQWSDINRVDYRPKRGLIKVLSITGIETQLSAHDGRYLKSAPRRNEWIEDLHQGTFLGEFGLWTWGLGMVLGLWVLWGSGLFLLLRPWIRIWRSRL